MIQPSRRGAPSERARSFVTAAATFFALLYVHLWIIEGALRKWVPGVDQVLYVARDGIALTGIVALAVIPLARRGRVGLFWLACYALAITALVYVIAGSISLPVAIAGVRAYIAPFLLPALFLTYRPPGLWEKVVTIVLAYLPVQLLISVLQSGSPPGAWINREVSGDEANFVQDGVVRASGTFSSPSGLTTFTILSFALALALSLQPGPRRRFGFVMLLPAAIVALVSGSRGTIFGILIVLVVAAVVTLARRPSDVVRLLVGLSVGITVGYWAVSAFWPEVLNALFSRFDDAAQAEDTGGRLFGQTFGFLLGEFPIFGLGPGAASLSGIALGSGATWVEVDSARWVAELGLIGLAAGIARLSLALYLTARLVTGARTLPWLAVGLIAVIVPILASGSITQNPTTQAAFGVTSTLLLGVMLAVREPSPTAPSNQATTPGGLNSMTTKGKT